MLPPSLRTTAHAIHVRASAQYTTRRTVNVVRQRRDHGESVSPLARANLCLPDDQI